MYLLGERGFEDATTKIGQTAKQMLRRMNIAEVIVAAAVLVATSAMVGTARTQQKAAAPKPQDKLALGEHDARQSLLPMDTDKNSKVFKQEQMRFMEAEFDSLDVDETRNLDVKELTQSRLRVSRSAPVGK